MGAIYTTRLNIPPRAFIEGFPGVIDRIEWFAIDYTGRIWIEQGGRYQFVLSSDDGSKLYLDQHLMIDNDGIHETRECAAVVELSRGIHEVRVSYFQGPRYQFSLMLTVAKPGEGLQIFDTRNFAPAPEAGPSDRSARQVRVRRVDGGNCASSP